MDFDEYEKRMREHRKKNFESFQKHFNEAMKKQGQSQTLDDVLGDGPPKPPGEPGLSMLLDPFDDEQSEQLLGLFLDLHKETADDDPRIILLRSLAVYRSFVKHARAGGQVKFVKEGEKDKVLKVRLR